jgi:hypothetical protein
MRFPSAFLRVLCGGLLMLVEISGVKLASDLRRMPVLAANQTGGEQPLKAHLVFASLAEKYLAQGVLQLFIFLQRPGMNVTDKDLGHETPH